MKKLVLGILLIPTLAFSQVSNWRTNPPQPQQQSQPQTRVQQSAPQQQNNISSWRNNQPEQSQSQLNLGRNTRIQNWNRSNQFGYYWGNWGWYQPFPYIWYDDFGLRQRSVINIYESGKRDTIRRQPVYTALGLGYTNNKQLAFWGMIGNKKSYFILDYTTTYAEDENQYFKYSLCDDIDKFSNYNYVNGLDGNNHKLNFGDVFLMNENNEIDSYSEHNHLDKEYIKTISNDLKSNYIYKYEDYYNRITT